MGTWEFNLINRSVTWSQELFQIFERSIESHVPTIHNFHDSIHLSDRFQWELMMNQVSITGKMVEIEVRIYVQNDGVKRVRMSAEGVYKDSILVSIRGNCKDVTHEGL